MPFKFTSERLHPVSCHMGSGIWVYFFLGVIVVVLDVHRVNSYILDWPRIKALPSPNRNQMLCYWGVRQLLHLPPTQSKKSQFKSNKMSKIICLIKRNDLFFLHLISSNTFCPARKLVSLTIIPISSEQQVVSVCKLTVKVLLCETKSSQC